jgi:hypothetical protein
MHLAVLKQTSAPWHSLDAWILGAAIGEATSPDTDVLFQAIVHARMLCQ